MMSFYRSVSRRRLGAPLLALLLLALPGRAQETVDPPPLPPVTYLEVTTLYGGPGAELPLKMPAGVAVLPDGRIAVADTHNNRIRLIEADGTLIELAGADESGFADGEGPEARFMKPGGIVWDPVTETLVVSDTDNDAVRRVSLEGVVTTLFAPEKGGPRDELKMPRGLAVAADGSLYIADTGNDRIRMLTAEGTLTTIAGTGKKGHADGSALESQFDAPRDLVLIEEALGDVLYVADTGNFVIRKIAQGVVTTIAGSPKKLGGDDGVGTDARFAEPSGIAWDRVGRLLVADGKLHTIRAIDLEDLSVTTIAGSVLGYLDAAPPSDAEFKEPTGIDAAGVVVIADARNDAIRLMVPAVQLSAISPRNARDVTEEGVIITGTGFIPHGTRVFFGETEVSPVAWISPSEIVVPVPDVDGIVDVTVTTVGGSNTLEDAWCAFVALAVEPELATVPIGWTFQFFSWGVRIDGTRAELTTVTEWIADDTIATVEEGLVTGVGYGVTPIEATTHDLSAVTALQVLYPDLTAPELTIRDPLSGLITRDLSFPIALEWLDPLVADDTYVAGVDPSTLVVNLGGTDITATFTIGADGASGSVPAGLELEDGIHEIVATVADLAGNQTQQSISFRFDTTPPEVTFEKPLEGDVVKGPTTEVSGSVVDSSPVAIEVNDLPAVFEDGRFTSTVGGPDGSFMIRTIATDAAGNVGEAAIEVTLDATPPVIVVDSPVEGFATASPGVEIRGSIDDLTDVTLTIGETEVELNDGSFTHMVELPREGESLFTLTATDSAGNVSILNLNLVLDQTPPDLVIASPEEDAILAAQPITIRGTASDATDVLVTVNDLPAQRAQEAWEAKVDGLDEGLRAFVVRAVDAAGNQTSLVRTVMLDLEAPVIVIETPVDGVWTNLATATMVGAVDDVTLRNLTVNGEPAPFTSDEPAVHHRFSLEGIHLIEGDNTLTARAADAVGRLSESSVTVTHDATPPEITITAPAEATRETVVSGTAFVMDNLAIDLVTVSLEGSEIASGSEESTTFSFAIPADAEIETLYTIVVRAIDRAGNENQEAHYVKVVSSGVLVGQVLDDSTGLPLAGVAVRIPGDAETATDATGRYSIPVSRSSVVVMFERGETVLVEREVDVTAGVGTVLLDARLTERSEAVTTGPSWAELRDGRASLVLGSGAREPGDIRFTALSPQGLPSPLPLGWSPEVGFEVIGSGTWLGSAMVEVQDVGAGSWSVAIYRAAIHAWELEQQGLYPSSDVLQVPVTSDGIRAVVMPDPGFAGSVVEVGEVLGGAEMRLLPESAVSTGSVTPKVLPPTGGIAIGMIGVDAPDTLPSGTVVQARVSETFALSSGEMASSEERPQDILLYRSEAPDDMQLGAEFPIVPSRTFEGRELIEGRVHLDILAGRETIRGVAGGRQALTVGNDRARLSIAAGSLEQDTAISIDVVPVSGFVSSSTAIVPILEIEVDLSGRTLVSPAQLSMSVSGLLSSDRFVVGKVHRVRGIPKMMAVARAELSGDMVTTVSDEVLPGIVEGGRYVLYRAIQAITLASGMTRTSSGPVAAVVDSELTPFSGVAGPDGRYAVIVPSGSLTLHASVPATSLRGSVQIDAPPDGSVVRDVQLAGVTTTATVKPSDGASRVPVSTQIEITATAPLNTTTLTESSVRVMETDSGAVVPVRLVVSGSGFTVALIPRERLEGSRSYTVTASGVADIYGGLVSVPTTRFTTESTAPPDYDTEAVVVSMPNPDGIVTVSAPPGSLAPGTTVMIVNAGNGVVVSFTVGNDGSLYGELPASIDDRLLMTITDPFGNVVSFERSRFEFNDGTGRVAVGPGGGVVEGAGGLEIRIPDGALQEGAVFRVTPFGPEKFSERPNFPEAQWGGGITISSPQMPDYEKEVDLVFPKPADAPDEAFYYVYRRLVNRETGQVLFMVVDEAFREGEGADAKIVTASPPYPGHHHSLQEWTLSTVGSMNFYGAVDIHVLMLWTIIPPVPFALPGAIQGVVYREKWYPGEAEPRYEPVVGARVRGTDDQGQDLVVKGTITEVTETDGEGRFALWDRSYQGGPVQIVVDAEGEVKTVVAYESNPLNLAEWAQNIYQRFRNVAWTTVTFPATELPESPDVSVHLIERLPDNTRRELSGIVIANQPMLIGLSQEGSQSFHIQQVEVNGWPVTMRQDWGLDRPSLPMEWIGEYTPTRGGTYTLRGNALPVDGGPPIPLNFTFTAVASGGGVDTDHDAAPDLITSSILPAAGAIGVSTDVLPSVSFTEPVTHVYENLKLIGDDGDVPIKVSAVGLSQDGTQFAIDDLALAGADTAVTSLTVRPRSGLDFGREYILELGAEIRDRDEDELGNPAPKYLVDAPRQIRFTTIAPEALGQSGDFASSNVVVFGNYAYVGERGGVNGFLRVFDIGDPSSPALVEGVNEGMSGQPIDIAGEISAPVNDGEPIVGIGAGMKFLFNAPSNLYVWDVRDRERPKRMAAVTLTRSTQEGTVTRVHFNKSFAYTLTFPYGIQVIDLRIAKANFDNAMADQGRRRKMNEALLTSGMGFSQDAIVSQFPVHDDSQREAHMVDLAVEERLIDGQIIPTAFVAGTLPLGIVNATSGSTFFNKRPLQGVEGSLHMGHALALGELDGRKLAAVAGAGSGRSSETGALVSGYALLIVDVTDVRAPEILGSLELNSSPSDVVLRDDRVLVALGNNVLIVNIADPRRPRGSGLLEGTGNRIGLNEAGLLVSTSSGLNSAYPGINTAVFKPVALVRPVDPILVEMSGDGSLEERQKVRVVEPVEIRARIVPVVDVTEGILQIHQDGILVDAIPLNYDSTGEAVAYLDGRILEDRDLVVSTVNSRRGGSLNSLPRLVKMGWVRLTVDANNDTLLDPDDVEAQKHGKPWAFWEDHEKNRVRLNSGEDKLQARKRGWGLEDYATIRLTVNKHWKSEEHPDAKARLIFENTDDTFVMWHLINKVGVGNDYLMDEQISEQQIALIGPTNPTTCEPDGSAFPSRECTSDMEFGIDLPDLPVGDHEFLIRCEKCSPDTDTLDAMGRFRVTYQRSAGSGSLVIDHAKADIRSLPEWISAQTAWQDERSDPLPTAEFRPMDGRETLDAYASSVPETAKEITVLVHGFNVEEESALEFFKTLTRRLYWSGRPMLRRQGTNWRVEDTNGCEFECAHTIGLAWPGAVKDLGYADFELEPAARFVDAEYRALQSGVPMARFFSETFTGRDLDVTVLAHSLGNMAVNSALTRPEMTDPYAIDTYVMYESAVPAEAFDTAEVKAIKHPAFFLRWLLGDDYTVCDKARWFTWQRPPGGLPDTPLDENEHGSWQGFFSENSSKTRMINIWNDDDAALFLWWWGAQDVIKPKLAGTLNERRESLHPNDERLWADGFDHSNILGQWEELAYFYMSWTKAVGSRKMEIFGQNNLNFSLFGKPDPDWFQTMFGRVIDPDNTHNYMVNRPLWHVREAYENLNKKLDDTGARAVPEPQSEESTIEELLREAVGTIPGLCEDLRQSLQEERGDSEID